MAELGVALKWIVLVVCLLVLLVAALTVLWVWGAPGERAFGGILLVFGLILILAGLAALVSAVLLKNGSVALAGMLSVLAGFALLVIVGQIARVDMTFLTRTIEDMLELFRLRLGPGRQPTPTPATGT